MGGGERGGEVGKRVCGGNMGERGRKRKKGGEWSRIRDGVGGEGK